MVFESPNIASKYVGAGQFVSILANDSWGHPLRRPMSIASVEKNNIVFYQQSLGLDVLVNIKTLKLKWPALENYYVLACKKIDDKNDINKKLIELID